MQDYFIRKYRFLPHQCNGSESAAQKFYSHNRAWSYITEERRVIVDNFMCTMYAVLK